MPYNPKIHHRRTTRLQTWDYSWGWWYYITICTHNRTCLFGEVVGDEMRLNAFGEIVKEEWLKTVSIRPEVELDDYVIMPNHLHGIIILNDPNQPIPIAGTHGSASANDQHIGADRRLPLRREPRSLSSFVAGFKSAVTKRINMTRNAPHRPVWQSRFHDHIVRSDADLTRIRMYIANNPLHWSLDEENPDNLIT